MTGQATQAIAPLDWVRSKDGKVITTSRIIAEVFDKEHFNVVRDVEKLECSKEFNALNFEVVKYKDRKGEFRKEYEITKDGAMFLIMGFTGKEAAQWKERFIEAFNAMESFLQEQARNARPSVAALPDGCLLITHLQGASMRQTKQGGQVLTHITDLLRYNALKGRATTLSKGRLRPFMVKAKVQHYSPAWYVTEEGIQYFLYEKSKGDFNPAYGKQLQMALSYSNEPKQAKLQFVKVLETTPETPRRPSNGKPYPKSLTDAELYWTIEDVSLQEQKSKALGSDLQGGREYGEIREGLEEEMKERGYATLLALAIAAKG